MSVESEIVNIYNANGGTSPATIEKSPQGLRATKHQMISPYHSFSKKSSQGKMLMLSFVFLSYRSQQRAEKF
jgi:hypothetical protein